MTTIAPAAWTYRTAEALRINGETYIDPDYYVFREVAEREVRPGVFLDLTIEAIVGHQDDCLGGGYYFDANGNATNDGDFGQFGTGYATAALAQAAAEKAIAAGIEGLAARLN